MKRLISSLAALVAVACLVSACGQKGPLYLPEDGKDGKDSKHAHQHQHAPAVQAQDEQPIQPEQTPEQTPEQ